MIEIVSIDDPRIDVYVNIKDRVLNHQQSFLGESEKVFKQFLHFNLKYFSTLSTKSFAEKYNLTDDNNFIVSEKLFNQIIGFESTFDIIFHAPKPTDFLINSLNENVLILNGVTSPENVGNIIRSLAAFDFKHIIIDEKSCSPFTRRSVRVSMGNIFSSNVYHSKNIRSDLALLKAGGFEIISTANISKSISLHKHEYKSKSALIIGSEGHGVDQDIIDFSDVVLKIPINDQVAHLNAANAATIFLFHWSQGL